MGQANVQSRPIPVATTAASFGSSSNLIRATLFVADAIIVTLTALLAVGLRTKLHAFGPAEDVLELVLPVMGLVIAVWILTLLCAGAYRQKYVGMGTGEYRTVLQGSLLTAGIIGISAYLFDYPLSRAFFFLAFLVGIPALLLSRFILRRVLHAARRRGMFRVPILLAGQLWRIDQLAETLRREPWLGYEPVGFLVHEDDQATSRGVPVMGTPDDIVGAVRRTNAAAVIFVEGSFRHPHHFNHLAREMEKEKAQLIVVPSLTEISSNRIELQTVAGVPLVTVAKPQAQRAGHGLKRGFDITLAAVALALLSPVILTTAIAIKVSDGGPVIYRQRRVGRQGKVFNCLKLRSMVPNADALKRQMLGTNDGAGVLFKLKDDPRVTTIGRFIRRYSIDELPQLWNVLRGEMSLVGPRPALESEVDQYKQHVTRRLDVRPGITGLWQVSGRSDLSWDDAVRLDLYYVDNWSFMQDLGILFRTVKAVLSPAGAY